MPKTSHDSETPAYNQQVITACALIHHDFDGVKKVFLAKRADSKKFLPGVFEIPGGHIDYGENIVEGLKREIKEELGIRIKTGDPFAVHDYTNEIKGSHSIEVIYFATLLDSPEMIQLHIEDHSEYLWISESEIGKVYTDSKGEDDIEYKALEKAFRLFAGSNLDFGE